MTLTGLEIGPDYCVLVKARQRGSAIEIGALRVIDPAEWPADLPAQSELLANVRRELGLPRRAAVVAWDKPTFATRSIDAMLRQAGFVVESVIAPADALALLAWSRSAGRHDRGAAAWLSINRHGAAMAIVDGPAVLHAAEFPWRIMASEQRVQANLLRRYLYVAQLAPELRQAITLVHERDGIAIELAITCGNIPDLRSFTMPLIQELDIEFETLDSLEGLHIDEHEMALVAPHAPALRLAGAAAAIGSTARAGGPVRLLGVAAALTLVAGAAWWAFTVLPRPAPDQTPQDTRPIVAAQGREAPPPAAAAAEPPRPVAESGQPVVQRAQPTTGTTETGTAPGAVEERTPPPEPPPLPVVGGILISSDRRLAVVNGVVVGAGDRVAGRTVLRIEAEAVVFRDLDGRELRVPVRDLRR